MKLIRFPVSCGLAVAAAAFLWGMPPAVAVGVSPEDPPMESQGERIGSPRFEEAEPGPPKEAEESPVQPQAVPLDGDIVFREVVVGPGGVEVQGEGGGVAGDDSRLIYSNTLGISAIYFYRPNQPVSDDIATIAPDGCNLKMFKFKVLGKVTSSTTCSGGSRDGLSCTNDAGCPGGGTCIIQDGPFTVKYALYSTCPLAVGPTNSTAYLRELVKIPGTSGEISFPDDTPRTIKHVVDPHNPAAIPTNLYLGLQFNRGNCGTVVGAPAMVGFSADTFDFPGFPCYGYLGGFPEWPHASFWLEMYGDPACPSSFPGYKNAQASGPTALLGAGVQGVDDIKLQVEDCQMISYEVAVRGIGFYNFDLRRQCDGQIIPGTERTFQVSASTTPVLQLARFPFNPPIPLLDDDLFLGFRSSSNSSGAVIAGKVSPYIGESSQDYFQVRLDGCQPVISKEIVNGAIHMGITCAGSPSTGACCDMGLTRCVGGPDDGKLCPCNFVCRGGGGNGLCCITNYWCDEGTCEPFCASPGTCEPVCRDVPKMNCPTSAKSFAHPEDIWVEGSTCARDPFVPACGVAACCKTDDTCENLTESQCMATATREEVVYWSETQYCESPGLECRPNVCRDPYKAGDCTLAHEEPGCSAFTGYVHEGTSLISCCEVVCKEDSWCCDVAWDRQCVQRGSELCILRPSFDPCFDSSELRGPLQIESGTTYLSNLGATESSDDPGFCCNASAPDAPGFGTVWLKFVASHESVEISTCGSNQDGDSLVELFAVGDPTSEQTACQTLSLIGCGDDGCSSSGRHSKLCVGGLTPGSTYYLMLASKTQEQKGTYQLEMKFPCQDLVPFPTDDCNGNGEIDGCDLAAGTSMDCNENSVPDECDVTGEESDCNENAVPDSCDIASGFSSDCQLNGVPDECDATEGFDCDEDGVPDDCGLMRAALRVEGSSPTFAVAVASHGEWLFVGDSNYSYDALVPGTVHIYRKSNQNWIYFQKLAGIGQQPGDLFGAAIAINNGILLVGAPGNHPSDSNYSGAVYVFRFNDRKWEQYQTLFPFDVQTPFGFGSTVAAEGNVIAVQGFDGVPYDFKSHVFVFSRAPSTQLFPEIRLGLPGGSSRTDSFGSAISIYGTRIFVGAPNELYSYQSKTGAVHIFSKSKDVWLLDESLQPPESDYFGFGFSIVAYGDRLLVGTSWEVYGPNACSGAVISYCREHVAWKIQQTISACDGVTRGFGASMDISGSDAVVGYYSADFAWAGLAKTYHLLGNEWVESAILQDPQIETQHTRRIDVSLGSGIAVIGTSTPDYPVLDHPATAYVFALPSRDCNENAVPDACETESVEGIDCNENGTPDICEPRQFADSDFSERVDLLDYAWLQRCFAGSGSPLAACCGVFDAEPGDGDADLVDFAEFVEAMTGP